MPTVAEDASISRRRPKLPKVTIREMEIDDIAPVYRLGERLFTSEEFPMLYRTWDPYEVTDGFTSDPDYCLVAESNGAIVGFVIATTVEKESTAWRKYGYLSWMGVAEEHQRSHLGKRLYRKLESILREQGARMMIADTEGNNEPAISFFKAMGFTAHSEHVWLAKTLRRKGVKKAVQVPGGRTRRVTRKRRTGAISSLEGAASAPEGKTDGNRA